MKRLAVAIWLLAGCRAAAAGLLGPTNYEECILQNMKGVGSDMAARAIAAACAKQFAPKQEAATPAAKRPPAPPPAEQKQGAFTDFTPTPSK